MEIDIRPSIWSDRFKTCKRNGKNKISGRWFFYNYFWEMLLYPSNTKREKTEKNYSNHNYTIFIMWMNLLMELWCQGFPLSREKKLLGFFLVLRNFLQTTCKNSYCTIELYWQMETIRCRHCKQSHHRTCTMGAIIVVRPSRTMQGQGARLIDIQR